MKIWLVPGRVEPRLLPVKFTAAARRAIEFRQSQRRGGIGGGRGRRGGDGI